MMIDIKPTIEITYAMLETMPAPIAGANSVPIRAAIRNFLKEVDSMHPLDGAATLLALTRILQIMVAGKSE
jgi:hypothetical protein